MATLAELQAKLVAYQAAEAAILSGAQSYSIAGKTLTRGDLNTIKNMVSELETRVARLSSGPRTAPVFINTRG